jgi:hypothetical protein
MLIAMETPEILQPRVFAATGSSFFLFISVKPLLNITNQLQFRRQPFDFIPFTSRKPSCRLCFSLNSIML